MDDPKSPPKRVQDETSGASRGDDKGDSVANKQSDATPAADATDNTNTQPEPISQVDGAVDPFISRRLEPFIELRVHRTNASREELDEEAVVLMGIIRECICNSNQLTGYLAGQKDATKPFQSEVAFLDATTSYLISILDHSPHARAVPSIEQVRIRADIDNRYSAAINRMRRLPSREPESDEPHPDDMGSFLPLVPCPSPEPFYRRAVRMRMSSVSDVWTRFEARAGRSRGSSGSSREEQAQQEVDGVGQSGSSSSQASNEDDVD